MGGLGCMTFTEKSYHSSPKREFHEPGRRWGMGKVDWGAWFLEGSGTLRICTSQDIDT
jgi:hypothetical protein